MAIKRFRVSHGIPKNHFRGYWTLDPGVMSAGKPVGLVLSGNQVRSNRVPEGGTTAVNKIQLPRAWHPEVCSILDAPSIGGIINTGIVILTFRSHLIHNG